MTVTDRMTPDKRSALMSRVRTKDTGPEMVVRRAIHAAGLRYQLHRRDLPGKPDIALSSQRVAIFVHGCFWHSHSCSKGRKRPQANAEFWDQKLTRNSERDAAAQAALENEGWSVKVVWECTLDETLADLIDYPTRRRAELRD